MKWLMSIILLIFIVTGMSAKHSLAQNEVAYVSLCFDDAHSSVYTLALPVFQQYNLAATVYVPTLGIDEQAFWHMSWKQILALQAAGWEIGSHSHTHQSMTQQSPEQVEDELKISQRILRDHGINAVSFATPLGDFNEEIIEQVKNYYQAHRGTEKVRGNNLYLSLNDLDIDPYRIFGIEIHYDYSLLKIESLIDHAVKGKKWIVFYLHAISDGKPEDKNYRFDVNKLSKLAAHLRDLQNQGLIEVVTIENFLEKRSKTITNH